MTMPSEYATFSDEQWVVLLRENARQLRLLSKSVIDLRASKVLSLQAEMADRSADRIELLLREQEMTGE